MIEKRRRGMNHLNIMRIALVVVLVGLVGMGAAFISIGRERTRRAQCLGVLDCCIRKASLMYAMDNNGAFPSNIHGIANYADNPKLFVCPGSGTKPPPTMAACTDWLDYIYISWPTGEKTPTNYPWLYDRRLSHHQGKGINVAPIAGNAFWDEGAHWLQGFAKTHPELKIPMPEDLKQVQ